MDGEDIYGPKVEVTSIRKKMGLLSQKPQVLPMSIYDNVAYGPRIHGITDKKELDRIVENYLKVAGLWEEVKGRLHHPASRLSVGQQQRLCLARGLAVGPEIILGDEPTSALDPQSSQNVEKRLMELKQDYTVVVVTHILRQARRIADYIVFLYLGELVEHGPAAEIFANPAEPPDPRLSDRRDQLIGPFASLSPHGSFLNSCRKLKKWISLASRPNS